MHGFIVSIFYFLPYIHNCEFIVVGYIGESKVEMSSAIVWLCCDWLNKIVQISKTTNLILTNSNEDQFDIFENALTNI